MTYSYYYSASTNCFLVSAWQSLYQAAGTWPDDAVSVADSVYNEFAGKPPEGKTMIAGADGMPAWGDVPAPVPDE